jgi:hypothetical protein
MFNVSASIFYFHVEHVFNFHCFVDVHMFGSRLNYSLRDTVSKSLSVVVTSFRELRAENLWFPSFFIIYHWCNRQAAHLPGSSEVTPIYHCRFRKEHLRLGVIAGEVGEPPHQRSPKHVRQLLPMDTPLSLQHNLWSFLLITLHYY